MSLKSLNLRILFSVSPSSPFDIYVFKKLGCSSYRLSHNLDFADCVPGCLLCFFVSIFSENWCHIWWDLSPVFWPQFAKCSSISSQDLFPVKELGLSARTKVTFQTMRGRNSQLFMYILYVVPPFFLHLRYMAIWEGFLNWNICCIQVITSLPKMIPYILWILQAQVSSPIYNLILFFMYPGLSGLESRKLKNSLILFYLIIKK